MKTQIDLYRTQQRWEVVKALATILAGCAVMMGATLALATWIGRHPNAFTGDIHADVRIEQPLVIHQQ